MNVMMRMSLFHIPIALIACDTRESASANAASAGQVSVVSSRPVESSDLIATGGSFRDKSDPF